jgi:GntP family gluconate:H+ symporter
MITAVGMFGGLASVTQLGFHPVYLALAIGCGSKPLPWMNDSGFWVIGRMSGMNERETLKTLTAQLTIMGVAGLLVVMLLAKVMPMNGA